MDPTGKPLLFAEASVCKVDIDRDRRLMQKLEIWAPAAMVALLQKCLETGLYGRTLEEAAERLIAAQLEQWERDYR